MLWHDPSEHATYSQVVELDLGDVEPSLAGPRRPQDRVPLAHAKQAFIETLGSFGVDYRNGSHDRAVADTFPASDPTTEQQPGGEPLPDGCAPCRDRGTPGHHRTPVAGADYELDHGSVVIAAITSCTNTSNPQVMVAAGLLARNAVARGPAAQAVGQVVARAGLEGRDALLRAGGPAGAARRSSASTRSATAARRASATRGRSPTRSRPRSTRATSSSARCSRATATSRRASIPEVKANYLASPPLVVAYALAGRMDIDFETEPIGAANDGDDVYLRDIWPSAQGGQRHDRVLGARRALLRDLRRRLHRRRRLARARPCPKGELFAWEPDSTYVRQPPYFEGMSREPGTVSDIEGARVPRLARRLGHDRPHLARRLDQARLARRARISSSTASSARTSTRTARGAATTR